MEEETIKEFVTRTPKSKQLWMEAKDVLPGGVASTLRFTEPYPLFIERGKGSRLWDVDGNEYIDFDNGCGVVLAGYANPIINNAVKEQLERASFFTPPHEKITLFARELLRRWPMMGMFRLTNSGTESTMHAIRLARAHTGKDKIVKIEGAYHGVHDYLLVSYHPPIAKSGPAWAPSTHLESDGIPIDTIKNTVVAPFNDIKAMENLFKRNEGEIAAVITEPVLLNCGCILPKEGYLRDLRELTEENNILLIFDEVKTGCRLAPGGASEFYKVEPDIVTLSKAVGGGFPLGAFGAKKEIMERLVPGGPTIHGGTYNGSAVPVAAGLAFLKEVLTDEAYKHINDVGGELLNGIKDIVNDRGIKAKVNGTNFFGQIFFTEEEVVDYRTAVRTNDEGMSMELWLSMINKGVIPWPLGPWENWFVSLAHTKEDIAKTLEAYDTVLSKIRM